MQAAQQSQERVLVNHSGFHREAEMPFRLVGIHRCHMPFNVVDARRKWLQSDDQYPAAALCLGWTLIHAATGSVGHQHGAEGRLDRLGVSKPERWRGSIDFRPDRGRRAVEESMREGCLTNQAGCRTKAKTRVIS